MTKHDNDESSQTKDAGESPQDGESNELSQNLAPLAEMDRRKLLAAIGVGGSLSLSGCMGLYSFGQPPEEWEKERGPVETDSAGFEEGDGDFDRNDDKADGEKEDGGGVETYMIEYLNLVGEDVPGLSREGETIEVPANKCLLEAGEEQGWDLPFQCRRGICGQCTARLWGDTHERVGLEDPDDPSRYNRFLADEELRAGFTLTCVGYPKEDFTLEVGERDALDGRFR